jgi:hypothetical protein
MVAMSQDNGGFVTPGIAGYAANIQPQGQGFQPAGSPMTIWDQLLMYFSYRYPTGDIVSAATPFIPGATPVSPGRQQVEAVDKAKREQRRMQQDRSRLMTLAREAGLNPNDPVQLADLWTQAVKEAQAAYSVDPRDDPSELVWLVLQRWADEGAPGTFKEEATMKGRRDAYFAEQGEPYEQTRVDTAISLTDPETARELIIEAWKRRVGRDPSEDEERSFIAALNARERANPRRTTTITRYAADGSVLGTNSSTEGGDVSPGAEAMSFGEDDLEGEERAFTAGVEYDPVIAALVGG